MNKERPFFNAKVFSFIKSLSVSMYIDSQANIYKDIFCRKVESS